MFLESLTVRNFRNLEYFSINLSKNLNIILGENGTGKTNLMESIYLLSGAKSFKKVKDEELIKFGENECSVDGIINSDGKTNSLKIFVSKEDSCIRRGFADGLCVGRAYNLAGSFCAVVFTPDNLSMVKRGKEFRRSFLDNAICNIFPSFINVLRRYNRLVMQKNALLKKDNISTELLDVLDEQLAFVSADIVRHRFEYIDGIEIIASKYYDGISNSGEKLKLFYVTDGKSKEDFIKLFLKKRETDKRYGYCGSGVHRDDINIELSDKSAKSFASQGQQRSIVLSIKKAEADYYFLKTGKRPVLLFDDVLSELDENRQKFLLSDISECQTFFTACDKRAFEGMDVSIFMIENNKEKAEG